MAETKLITDVRNFERASLTAVTGSTVPAKIVTQTQPVSAPASGSVVFGPSLNYLKMKLHSTTNDALTVSVFGWSYYSRDNTWVPQLLVTLTTTVATSAQNIPGLSAGSADQYEISSYVVVSGDAKVYNSPSTATAGAFVLLDTLGAEFVEVYATAFAATPTVNVWTSGL